LDYRRTQVVADDGPPREYVRCALSIEGAQPLLLGLVGTVSLEAAGRFEPLCSLLELLEPKRQPVSVRTILKRSRPVDQFSDDPLKAEFEKRAVMDFEQAVRDVDSVIRVNADQVGIKRGMMDFRQR
jgi:hypothetical protein